MENQHQHIHGYRDLDETEIAQMNEVKAMADRVGELVHAVTNARTTAEGKRWAATARTDLQKGFMALVRSIALPDSF